jgi:hypothetical protein
VTDLATVPGRVGGSAPSVPSVLPGEVVRGLVTRYEEEIAALALELEVALHEAAEAERRCTGHSIADVLSLGLGDTYGQSLDAETSTPAFSPVDLGGLDIPDRDAPVPDPGVLRHAPPRTTVVTRPRAHRDEPLTPATPWPTAPGPNPTTGDVRPRAADDSRSGRWRTQWMTKAGVVIALLGLLLLKFG